MNILVIHEVSYEGKVVYEYQDFAERLNAKGHRVFVIDFDESGQYFHKGEKSVSRTGIGNVKLYSTPCLNLPVLRFITGKLYFKTFLNQFIKEHKIDVVWLYSVFINGTGTIEVCKKLNIPVVYRVLDIYHKVRQNPFIKVPLLLGEKFIYKNADYLSFTNDKIKKYVESLINENIDNHSDVLFHGVDTEFFGVFKKEDSLLKSLHIEPNDKVIFFLGTLYTFSGLNFFIEELSKKVSQLKNVKLLIVGDGEQMPLLKQLVEKHQLSKFVILAGKKDYLEVPKWMSLADLTITPFEINDITKDIFPIKVLQYLSMGKTMVCAPIEDVMKIMPTSESGVEYINILESERFFDKTIEIVKNEELLNSLNAKARNFIEKNYSINIAIDKVEKTLKKVLKIN